ncbi:MAG: fibronectin type III domain-containing protein [Dysgonamonadaceae bacterium]|jgi:hypothetical protein|nr:fibronectin type III domain-containing protein [Dysgonamonadaceae bacterium]
MKNKLIYKGIGTVTLLIMFSFSFISCEEIPPVGDETTDRLFSPVNLNATAKISSIEVSWYSMKDASSYRLELFAKDSLELLPEHKVASAEITESKYTFDNLLSGTRYTIGVIAISADGRKNSIVSKITVVTEKENILKFDPGSITKNSITLQWPANAEVTSIKVVSTTDETFVEYLITPDEKTAGEKTCDELTAETAYVAYLYNGEIERGSVSFQTLADGIVITPETEGISDLLNNAQDGDVFVFAAGDYSTITNIQLVIADKSIKLKSQNTSQKAGLYIRFILSGNASVSVESLIINGNKIENGVLSEGRGDYYVFDIGSTSNGPGINEGSILVSDCEIKNFIRSLVRGTAGTGLAKNISFTNCIIENVCNANNDFFDLRTIQVEKISFTNSTFIASPTGRHMFRCDAIEGFSGQQITIDYCTFYNLELGANRLIYQRVAEGSATMKNCAVEKVTAGNLLQAENLVVDYNYYFNVTNNGGKVDEENGGSTTNYVTGYPLDHSKIGSVSPFIDAINGNFGLTPETEARTTGEGGTPAGDPRWR